MIIDLNTDELQSVVQIARRANEQLTEAANLLNSVVIHNDWQCPERSEINNNTSRNRQQALTMQSDAERLYQNICYVSEQFLAAEQEVYRSFDAVDGPIASFLSKTPAPASAAGNKSSGAWDVAADILQSAGGGVANGLKQAASVISFDSIADAFKGK